MLSTTRSLLALLALSSTAVAQDEVVRYEVRFDATWSAQTHPGAYPGGAHFSGPIGGTHGGATHFWEEGELASPGIESMAETGSQSALRNEVEAAIAAGLAGQVVSGGGINSPGSRTISFPATEEFSAITLVTMIAPSPDWFVGVDGLDLRAGGQWADGLVVELLAWDSGTDSGTSFNSPNQDTNPAEPIHLITGGPFTGSDPLGTFTFTLVPLGSSYCGPAAPNSTGNAASIHASGNSSAGGTITLIARDLPPNQFGYFLASMQRGSSMPPASDGFLCLAGNIGRFSQPGQIRNSGSSGGISLGVETTSIPVNPPVGVQPGETWYFQAWYRDTVNRNNFSDGVAIDFQ
ncbi:MAG: hypothetical protein GY711_23320 [bacterium]|nr:hypothetical protein [bacterium]